MRPSQQPRKLKDKAKCQRPHSQGDKAVLLGEGVWGQPASSPQSCPTLCDPVDRSTPGFPVHHQLPEFTQTHVHRVSDATNHLILCCPLLLLPSFFPSIRVFSNESAFHIRWPKYWSFSFSTSNEYLGVISSRMDWWISLQSKGLS